MTTMYQTPELHDAVRVDAVSAVRAAETWIVLSSNHPWVPQDNRNMVWKIVERCRLCCAKRRGC